MYRIGYNHQYVQSLTQNAVHKYLVKTPFFLGTADKGHLHWRWGDKGTDEWFWFR